ncbi:MAG: LysR family transcriptional regulator, partial [Rhodoferax sp.]|nr:LysR family transcriptional regulator [Rhodoferax sp.]
MTSMPPLKALHYFDAAMRLRSFSLAGEELSVTPGAVGQQIRKLEAWLGLTLFTRQVRQVLPTPDGLAYWARIQPALAQIADASRTLRDSHSHSARLTMPPTLAAKWFARRMPDFVARHPLTALHLSSSTQMADFNHEPIDLAVRYFDGQDPTLEVHLLYADQVRVFCSPGYLARIGVQSPADLGKA